ncbi:MAG: response regulator [Gammaproteobacteria bacterium]|nr:response regulator [Gammaproteobacteria bacterium]
MIPTVFLVDDDAAVRDALGALFRAEGLAVSVHESAEAFLADLPPDACGCLVLDLRMSGLSGIELQKTLADRNVGLPIIFLTGHGDIPMSVRALKAGAIDFFEKPADPDVLLTRVQEALALDVERRTAGAQQAEMDARYTRLTEREREILAQVAEGRTSKEIARSLRISPRTVEVHRSHIMTKLGADSLADLIRIAQLCTSGVPAPPR